MTTRETYSLAQVRNGTGWPTNARFMLVDTAAADAVAEDIGWYCIQCQRSDLPAIDQAMAPHTQRPYGASYFTVTRQAAPKTAIVYGASGDAVRLSKQRESLSTQGGKNSG